MSKQLKATTFSSTFPLLNKILPIFKAQLYSFPFLNYETDPPSIWLLSYTALLFKNFTCRSYFSTKLIIFLKICSFIHQVFTNYHVPP